VNKETFFHLLQPSVPITPSETNELEEIVQRYPYCQLAHFLVAKAHQQQENAQVSEKVKKAAVYAVNRNVLKKLLLVKPAVTESRIPPVTETETVQHQTYPETPDISEAAEKVAEPELPIDPPPISFLEQEPSSIQAEENQPLENLPVIEPEVPTNQQPISINIRRIDKVHQSEIIDSFIKNEPRISALQKTGNPQPESTQDLSEKSITLPSGLISENLAGIMIKQGKIDKAIDIYEKLILKYPQKKAYFAEKIDNLKNP
jgi:tetratricopeptide (TPR) repeat protein